ncbi:MAG: sigma-70 family RNA polymerase sigma factor [Labilithrix sp.]|nr:sigma-70 family RNA polymerase sigma factor [Labilithrix sp.]
MLHAVADTGEATKSTAAAPVRAVDADLARRRAEADAIDHALVVRAQAGERVALGELLHKYGPGLYRSVLLPRLGSEAAAKEALSETYAKVVANISKFTWQNVGFYPWLRTVALRVALDQLRAKKRLVLFEEDDLAREVDAAQTSTPVEQQISDQRDRDAARAKVDAALGRINARYARAIRLRVLEERPRDEVAAELGVTPATFDVLLHRAIASLKKTLEAGEEPKAGRKEGDG